MASIEAFLELAGQSSDPQRASRASLRRTRASRSLLRRDSRADRAWAVMFVVILQVIAFLGLRAAMRSWSAGGGRDAPLTVTFIVPPRPIVNALPAAPPSVRFATTGRVHATAVASRPFHHDEALQAVAVPQAADWKPPGSSAPPPPLYSRDGELLLPSAPATPAPRDLLAHRDASSMLPGAPRRDSPDFHVRAGLAPQDVVNAGGRILSGLLARGQAPPLDSMGLRPPRPDRGLRTSGRDTDPCEDIAIDMNNLQDRHLAEMAEERYERSCEGH